MSTMLLERTGSDQRRSLAGPEVEGGFAATPAIIGRVATEVGDELAREGRDRSLQDGQKTMRARDLCPTQGNTATRGFRAAFRR